NPSVNKNQMVFDLVNFNLDNYQTKNYKTEATVESGKYIAITVGTFANAEEATAYIKSLDVSKVIRGADKAVLSVYIISRDNLEQFRTDKSPERYRIFYQSNQGLSK
ncbi:MAG TPA: hypothetical protein PLP69_09105, partial [Bacteroidales bacterium]|nr:hypothetical protein [Bacteroidales bacterium]